MAAALPPFGTGAWLTLTDPEESFELPGSRRSFVMELTFDEGSAATPTVLVNVAV